MQAAAYEYDFDKTRNLTGMHDCYEMVKDLSSSISPNISLIYQLVEWEGGESQETSRWRPIYRRDSQECLGQDSEESVEGQGETGRRKQWQAEAVEYKYSTGSCCSQIR